MPIPFISCRNTVTGALAEVPETALPHMTNWVPVDQVDADAGTGDGLADPAATPTESDAPSDGSASAPAAGESDAPPGPSRRTAKSSKPDAPATEKKE